jgi:hypothetical protein
MLVALLALFVALGGPAHAERLINGSKIKAGTVSSKQIKDRSVKERDLEPTTVRALRATPNGTISDAKLAPNAVTTRALAPGSVLTGTVGDNSLTAADLAANAVGTDEVADNAVGQSEIRSNGVAASEIADNSIDGGEIIDGGLSMRDVARQVGPLAWAVARLGPNQCEAKLVAIGEFQMAGDFVLISPTSPWPPELTYAVVDTSSETEFKVAACNRTGEPFPGAAYTFNYAVIDF